MRELLILGPVVVGLTFVWSGAIKAIAPHTFYSHLSKLGFIPQRLLSAAVILAAGAEVGLGAALIVGLAPGIMLPATVVLLAILSTISWWGVRSGRAADCGCYGGYIQPSITQSLALNAAFAGLVAIAWTAGHRSVDTVAWKALATLVAVVVAAGFTFFAVRHWQKTGKPLIDTNPMKEGRAWNHAWAGGATKEIEGEVIVSFLGPECPFCVQWVRVANVMIQAPSLPSVVGVVSTSKSRLAGFAADNLIRFPVVTISPSLMGRLTQAVPTVALVNGGRIEKLWVGTVPPDFVDRFRQAFFPHAVPNVPPRADEGRAAEAAGSKDTVGAAS